LLQPSNSLKVIVGLIRQNPIFQNQIFSDVQAKDIRHIHVVKQTLVNKIPVMKHEYYFESEEEASNDEIESVGLTGLAFLSVPVILFVLFIIWLF
jgi:hypothetical protein